MREWKCTCQDGCPNIMTLSNDGWLYIRSRIAERTERLESSRIKITLAGSQDSGYGHVSITGEPPSSPTVSLFVNYGTAVWLMNAIEKAKKGAPS